MKTIRTLAASLLCLTSALPSVAQHPEYRTCDTDVMWQKALAKDPSLAEKARQSLEFFRSYAGAEQKVETSTLPVLYIIPTVFHVIHNYGIEDISRAQIHDAVDILNKSFQKLNDDTGDVIPLFQPIFADCQIEFRLATLDPAGNCTDGINYVQSELTYGAGDNVKSLIDWPSDRYLNIWVVSDIGSGAAGYSYYPGITSTIDGIVIRHDYVGGIGTSNGTNYTERSLTHEVGHWLNLPHTWGNSNSPGDPANCGMDDGVFDTPNTIGTLNFTCNVNQVTCGSVDNVQNYMDYAGCHKMFTEGQKARMHAALNSAVGDRNYIHSAANLLSTGTDDGTTGALCNPVADFTNRKILVCAGTPVNFKDLSWGADITARQWTFNGGTPSSSAVADPVIIYNTPGIYDVTLFVSNSTGSDQLTRTALVEVLSDTGLYKIPISEDFENIVWPSDWNVENPDNNNAWSLINTSASSGIKSLRLLNQSGNSSGSIDAVISPVLDFSGAAGVTLKFDVAFARKNSNDASNLKVSATNNCGQGWAVRYNKTGASLETAPLTSSPFIPGALQWRTETVSLASGSISGKPSVRLKFEYTNDMGNNIYIDNINITGNITSVAENPELSDMEIYPNPADDKVHIAFNLEKNQIVRISIKDLAGREILTHSEKFTQGHNDLGLPLELASGIYIINIASENVFYSQKLSVK
jgi:PKD repeat protein